VGTDTDRSGLKADSVPPGRHFPQTVAALVLVLLVVIVYLPSVRGRFLWDDDFWTTRISGLLRDVSGLRLMWCQPTALQQYYPLSGTSFWLDYHLWGFWTLPYHVENVLLHATSAVLFWQLLRRLETPGAWLAGAVFAVHPVMVESVGWITERKNVLSLVFYLGALLAYGHFHSFWKKDNGSPVQHGGSYALALLLFLSALLAKTTAFSLPAVVVLIGWWKRGRVRWRDDVLPTLPMFGLAIGFCLVTAWLEKTHVVAQGPDFALTFPERCLIAGRATWFYVGKLLWPANLCFVYPRWQPDAGSWRQWLYPATAAGVLAALWLARRRIGRGPVTAALFFVGTLFPLLGFLNAYGMRYSFVWDHWVYLPSLGLIALAAVAGVRWLTSRTLQIVVAAVVILVLSVLGWQRAHAFQSNEQLWTDTLRKNPAAFLAHNNLADIRSHEGEIADATAHWREALRISPTCWEAWMGLGKMDRDTGHYAEAIDCFQHALQLQPGLPDARYGLGMVYARLSRWPEAREQFEQALEMQPHEAKIHFWLGDIAAHQGRTNDAIQQYLGAIQEDPALADAYLSLGHLRLQRGETERAIRCFDAVLRLRPGDTDAQSALAAIRTDTEHRSP
jgi:tetratricopeptide (TPR) repeat protein